jgi:hypothetical protein
MEGSTIDHIHTDNAGNVNGITRTETPPRLGTVLYWHTNQDQYSTMAYIDSGNRAPLIIGKITEQGGIADNIRLYTDGRAEFDNNVYMKGNLVQTSDYRLKTDIVDVDLDALSVLNKIKTKSYNWIETGKHVDVGIIAQQLEDVLPNIVYEDELTAVKSIGYIELIPYIVKAIQEISDIINPQMQTLSFNRSIPIKNIWQDDMTEEDKLEFIQTVQQNHRASLPAQTTYTVK